MRSQQLALVLSFSLVGCNIDKPSAERCDAPLSHWRKPSNGMNHHAILNRISIAADGTVSWNKKQITERMLIRYLDQIPEMNPLPFLILEPSPDAPCATTRRVRALMDARSCKARWACGEGIGAWDSVMDMPPSTELRRLEAIADDIAASANNTTVDEGRP